jgi:hypothetical protein
MSKSSSSSLFFSSLFLVVRNAKHIDGGEREANENDKQKGSEWLRVSEMNLIFSAAQ